MTLNKGFYFINFYKSLSVVNNNIYKTFFIKFVVYRLWHCVGNLSYKIIFYKMCTLKLYIKKK